jgi:polyisoprenoid-binding protein YceI
MILRLALAASLVLAAAPLYATTYTIEPDYTQAVFRWSHLGFSNPAAQLSRGRAHSNSTRPIPRARPSTSRLRCPA